MGVMEMKIYCTLLTIQNGSLTIKCNLVLYPWSRFCINEGVFFLSKGYSRCILSFVNWAFNTFHISLIHPRCIKEVFSDATVFIADFGLFLHHIGSDSNPGMTLEEPSRLRDCVVLRSCLYQSKKNLDQGQTSAVLIDICPLVNSQWKQGIPHFSAI